jgi:RHS repeat-associated protein
MKSRAVTTCLRHLLGIAGLLLMLLAGAARADVVTYFHNDISGTPLAATDEGGNLLWKETYRPYGERLLNGAGPDANRLWFGGKPQDPDTGLSYLGARYYSPQLGRFVGVDPKAVDPENLHSFNRYAYGNNNPYKFVDPDGRNPLLLAAVGLALWLGDALRPMPDLPPGSGMVEPASLPDLSGVVGAAKGLGVAAMAIRTLEKTAIKEGAEIAAKELPIITKGTKEWSQAVDDLSNMTRGKANYRTESATDAKSLLEEARGNMDRRKQYTTAPYKKGYEMHNDQNARELGAGNDLQHLK